MACTTFGSVNFLFIAPVILMFLVRHQPDDVSRPLVGAVAGPGPGHRLGDQADEGDAGPGGRRRPGGLGGPIAGAAPLVRTRPSGPSPISPLPTRLPGRVEAPPRATVLRRPTASRRPPSGPRPTPRAGLPSPGDQCRPEEQRPRADWCSTPRRPGPLQEPVHRRTIEGARAAPAVGTGQTQPAVPGPPSAPAAGRLRPRRSPPCGTSRA